MIEYIRGEVAELTPAMAVLEAAGVGYALGISLNTYTALQARKKPNCSFTKCLSRVVATTLTRCMALQPDRNANSIACSSPFREWAATRHA